MSHIWFYGLMQISGCMAFGFAMAVFMDQRIRQEDAFRTIFLYPFALSLVIIAGVGTAANALQNLLGDDNTRLANALKTD